MDNTAVLPNFPDRQKEKMNRILSLQKRANQEDFNQQLNTSFMIMILSYDMYYPDDGSISIFAPEAVLNGSFSDIIENAPPNSMHQHNYFEFAYVLKGNMYQIVEGKRYFYPTGSCCLMNRNTRHTEELSQDFTCIFFCVSPDFVTRLNNYGNHMLFPQEQHGFDNLIFRFMLDNLDPKHENRNDFLDFVPKVSIEVQKEQIHDIFERMIRVFLNPYYGATYRLQNLFFQLMNALCNPDYFESGHIDATERKDAQLFSRIDCILSQKNGRITNRELAEILNYNGSYLGRVIKKNTNMSLFDYSMTFTMKAATNLLRETSLNVNEIMQQLRFTNRSHFYKLFKKQYGVTPQEYREKSKAGCFKSS